MRLLWTKSTTPLSWIIRSVTGEDCSHFSIVLYDGKPGQIVFESNLLGTHPAFLSTALKNHTIVHEYEEVLSQEIEDSVMDLVQKVYDGKDYDFGGAFYLGWRKLLYRIVKAPIPMRNKWASKDKYFCDEIYSIFKHFPQIKLPDLGEANAMRTPHDVWLKINEGAQ